MSFALASQIMNFGATFIVVNLSLAFFNLIPIPPLDGSSIIVPFLKGKALNNYYHLQQYAMPILILVLYLLPTWTGIDVIGRYFDVTVYPLAELLLNFAIAASKVNLQVDRAKRSQHAPKPRREGAVKGGRRCRIACRRRSTADRSTCCCSW